MNVLTLNGGSSSLKVALFAGDPPSRIAARSFERVTDFTAAFEDLRGWLEPHGGLDGLLGVGHRIVHGGSRFEEAVRITPEVIVELRRLAALDPTHLPAEIALVDAVARRAPRLSQVACFDTAFHRTMPRVARMLPIPHRYDAMGVQRYGFHGLSYAFLMQELARVAGAQTARGRVILAHLGNGASLCACKDGRSVDTTMGFTPAGGIMMGTRPGDLDPGVLVHLLRAERLDADALDDLLNRRSGLLGVSGTGSDVRDLLAREAEDPRAAEALALFSYRAKKEIGAMAAALGGVDTLVFAGGIGENAPALRARIAGGLEHLGVALDPARNAANAAVVSAPESRATVRVMHTDEESMIAHETLRVLAVHPTE
jgi:acetate kinase